MLGPRTEALLAVACGFVISSVAEAQEPSAITTANAIVVSGEDAWIRQVGFFDEELGDPMTILSLLGDDSPLDVGGWMQGGYHNRPTGLFNSHPHKFNAQQMWLYAGKEADGSKGFDWGFRIDAMYGVDGPDTQAFGNPPGIYDFSDTFNHGDGPGSSSHGWAIPQLYGEVAFGDVSVIAGHFYTLLGYEVVQAPDNFFYSHAFTEYLDEAFTHTGVLATYSVSDDVTLYGGWTLGWDTGFAQFNSGSSFLGGARVALLDNVTITYILTAGNLGMLGNGSSHSVVGDIQITDSLNYIIQSDFVHANINPLGNAAHLNAVGVNQYLIYWLNDRLGVGGRAEWWRRRTEFPTTRRQPGSTSSRVPTSSSARKSVTSGLRRWSGAATTPPVCRPTMVRSSASTRF